jgi:hypothetical protein
MTQNEKDYLGNRWREEEGIRVRTRGRKKNKRHYEITSITDYKLSIIFLRF